MEAVNVKKLHADNNAIYARYLRELADRVEAAKDPIRGYAVLVVYADGSLGCQYDQGSAYAPVIGALEYLKYRMAKDWDAVD